MADRVDKVLEAAHKDSGDSLAAKARFQGLRARRNRYRMYFPADYFGRSEDKTYFSASFIDINPILQ